MDCLSLRFCVHEIDIYSSREGKLRCVSPSALSMSVLLHRFGGNTSFRVGKD